MGGKAAQGEKKLDWRQREKVETTKESQILGKDRAGFEDEEDSDFIIPFAS